MFPVLVTIGPVAPLQFFLLIILLAVLYLFFTKVVRLKGDWPNNLLFLFLIVALVALVLMIFQLSFPLRTYGIMIATGFLLATALVMRHSKEIGITHAQVMDLAVVTLLAGIIGTRIFYILFFNWDYYVQNPMKMFAIWEGGQVLYGGIIFGFLAILFFLKSRRIPILKTLDVLFLSLLIGIGFGRLGCLGAGCCYGRVSEKFGLVFPKNSDAFIEHFNSGLVHSDALASLPVLPTQLMESLMVFIFFFILYAVYRKRKAFDGQIMSLVLILYAVERFVIEYLRVNPFWGPFTVAQWTSLLLFVSGAVVWLVLRPGKGSGNTNKKELS